MLDPLAGDRQDGALHRLHHNAVRGAVGADQGVSHFTRPDQRSSGKFLRHAAEQLRQDHAGIAPRTEQHPAAQIAHIESRFPVAFRLPDAVGKRQAHIGARIPVGNGKDVQPVQFLLRVLEIGQTAADHLFKLESVYPADAHSSGDFLSSVVPRVERLFGSV